MGVQFDLLLNEQIENESEAEEDQNVNFNVPNYQQLAAYQESKEKVTTSKSMRPKRDV